MVYGASESWSSSVSEGEEEEEEGGKREKREIMTVGGGDLCPRFLVLGRACFACLLGGGKKVTQWVGGETAAARVIVWVVGKRGGVGVGVGGAGGGDHHLPDVHDPWWSQKRERERERSGPGLAWENRWG